MNIGGSAEKQKKKTTSSKDTSFSGEKRERLDISDEAVDKIIADVLGGANGLASVFAGEQTAGIFDSSVSAQAAGDMAANLAGEIAKLRAEKIVTEESEEGIRAKEAVSGTTVGGEASFKI